MHTGCCLRFLHSSLQYRETTSVPGMLQISISLQGQIKSTFLFSMCVQHMFSVSFCGSHSPKRMPRAFSHYMSFRSYLYYVLLVLSPKRMPSSHTSICNVNCIIYHKVLVHDIDREFHFDNIRSIHLFISSCPPNLFMVYICNICVYACRVMRLKGSVCCSGTWAMQVQNHSTHSHLTENGASCVKVLLFTI